MGLVLQGDSIGLFLIPRKLPIKIKGKAQNIHRINNDIISDKFTAADDFSIDKKILTKVYPKNNNPGNNKDVNIAFKTQDFPLTLFHLLF